MSQVRRPRPKSWLRRMERWFVGLVMALVALVLERIVMRSVRRQGKDVPEPESTSRVITARGAEAEVDAE